MVALFPLEFLQVDLMKMAAPQIATGKATLFKHGRNVRRFFCFKLSVQPLARQLAASIASAKSLDHSETKEK